MAVDKIETLISQMTLAEKVSLLSGAGACKTSSLDRLGIPTIHTSDGPHGLRGGGGAFFNPPLGYQLPAAVAMGATFDVDLLHCIGNLLGDEGRRKGVHVALAPTVCLQRSPLLGRGFEAFGEDPELSGSLAAPYVNGLQERKVASCIKHYAAHDQSFRAAEDDLIMTERTLREVHLYPFQVAMAKSKPWALMSAYQSINGTHVSEDPFMLDQVLRKEWGFEGLVMSDWWGTYSTSEATNAGLDLEMPGPSIWRGKQLTQAVAVRKVHEDTINASVRRLLHLINKTRDPGPPSPEGNGDTNESRALIRKVAADAIVLLKNEKNVLPLDKTKKLKYGLIGEYFENPATGGGGSSETVPFYFNTPLDAFIEAVGNENVTYEPGVYTRKWIPLIRSGLTIPNSNEPGLMLEWFSEDPSEVKDTELLQSTTTTSTSMYFSQIAWDKVPACHFVRCTTTFTAPKSCKYRFALSVCGKARLFINGIERIDLWSTQPLKTGDTPCFNKLCMEMVYDLDIEQGREYALEVIMTNELLEPVVGPPAQGGFRIGGQELRDQDVAINAAVDLAKSVDVPIVIVGLNADYESEAADRKDLLLPGRQNELVQRVTEVNPNTIVITQSGLPIQMPWIKSASTLLHAWYLGQETGHGIIDVLFGDVNPSGRLSMTFPKQLEDTPAFLSWGKSDRHIIYGEGVFIGYRYYEKVKRDPLFYFGFGQSFTSFAYSNLVISDTFVPEEDYVLEVSVDIENTGNYDGSEVIQLYVADLESSVLRPIKELKAFKKIFIKKGEKQTCHISLDKYSLSFWSEEYSQWLAEAGDFAVIISRSADPKDEITRAIFNLPSTFRWSGL
ncbi:unnamed protein product [Penicillium crustosum]